MFTRRLVQGSSQDGEIGLVPRGQLLLLLPDLGLLLLMLLQELWWGQREHWCCCYDNWYLYFTRRMILPKLSLRGKGVLEDIITDVTRLTCMRPLNCAYSVCFYRYSAPSSSTLQIQEAAIFTVPHFIVESWPVNVVLRSLNVVPILFCQTSSV